MPVKLFYMHDLGLPHHPNSGVAGLEAQINDWIKDTGAITVRGVNTTALMFVGEGPTCPVLVSLWFDEPKASRP